MRRALAAVGLRRDRVARMRMLAERRALALLHRRTPRPHGRILCYHSVGQPGLGVNDIDERLFCQQIEDALAAGYTFRKASELAADGGGPMDLAVTFDDAWDSVASRAVPILARYGVPMTLFAVSDWSSRPQHWNGAHTLGWRDLDALLQAGVELGSHSKTHPDFGTLSRDQAREELEASRDAFRVNLGFAPATFAIPLGQSANWNAMCADLARQAGYEVVYAQAEATRAPGTVARTFITCFDRIPVFRAALSGAFDRWEEWV